MKKNKNNSPHGQNEQRTTKIEQPKTGTLVMRVDSQYYRPTEVDLLIGDPCKSKKLGWYPQYTLEQLIKEMVVSDLNKIIN